MAEHLPDELGPQFNRIRFRGADVPWVPLYEYLGHFLDDRLTFDRHLEETLKMTRTSFDGLLYFARHTRLPVYVFTELIDTRAKPILLARGAMLLLAPEAAALPPRVNSFKTGL